MKKRCFLLILILVGIFCLSGCFNNNDISKFKKEYESLNGEKNDSGKEYPSVLVDSNNNIEYLSMKEASELIDEGSGVFYFGYPSCPWCRNAVSVLLEAVSSTDLDKIYYIDMKDVRDVKEVNEDGKIIDKKKASAGYYELIDELEDILLDYTYKDGEGKEISFGVKRIYVPLVVFVLNGEIVSYHLDTVDSQKDPYIELDEEQKIELFNIYVNGIHKVLGDVCEEDARC